MRSGKSTITMRLDRSVWEGAQNVKTRKRVLRELPRRAARERRVYELVILFDKPAKNAVSQRFRFDGRYFQGDAR